MMFNFSLHFSREPLVCCQLLCLEVGGGERARESKGAREQEGARESKGVNRAIASRLKRRGGHLMLLLTTIGAALMLH